MWSETLATNQFINLKNIFSKSKPVIDIDFMINEIMQNIHPINIQKVIDSKTDFYTVVTNCETGKAEYFLNNNPENFLDLIKASSSIPMLYNKPTVVDGIEYMDGAIADSLPINKAIELGAKEIYVLLTRHEGYRKKSGLADIITATLHKKYPMIKTSILNRHIFYNECLEIIENKKEGIEINIIRPRYNLGISRTTSDPKKLKSAFFIGYYDALKILKSKKKDLVSV